MEAIAKHDFQSQNPDELSFTKGSKLKIINLEADQNWYKAEMRGQQGYVPVNYIEMEPHDWYMKNIGRAQAETKLLEKSGGRFVHENGAFLVRPSDSSPGEFSLSVKFHSSCQHYKILRDQSQAQYYVWDKKFQSLNQLVSYYRTTSVDQQQSIILQDMTRNQKKVVANYDFEPGDPSELRMRRGDIVTVTEESDPNWWTGEIMRGSKVTRGLFPKTYVSSYAD